MLLVYTGLIVAGIAAHVGLIAMLRARPVPWDQHIKWVVARPWAWRDVGRLVLIEMGWYTVLTGVYTVLNGSWEEGENEALEMVTVSSFHVIALVYILGLLFRRGLSCKRAFGVERDKVKKEILMGIVFYLAVLPFFIFYLMVYAVWLRVTGQDPVPQEIIKIFYNVESPSLLFVFVLLVVMVAPFTEECVFRGIGLPLLIRKWGWAPAILTMSLLFAMLHYHLSSFIPLFFMGIGFSLAYLYTRSIVPSIVMHALFNGINLSLLMLAKSWPEAF